jgi:hypothetical protein
LRTFLVQNLVDLVLQYIFLGIVLTFQLVAQ